MQGLAIAIATREVGLSLLRDERYADAEGDGRLRAQRVSVACLVPVSCKERERAGGRKERDRGRRC
jgi:hypothetical protein